MLAGLQQLRFEIWAAPATSEPDSCVAVATLVLAVAIVLGLIWLITKGES